MTDIERAEWLADKLVGDYGSEAAQLLRKFAKDAKAATSPDKRERIRRLLGEKKLREMNKEERALIANAAMDWVHGEVPSSTAPIDALRELVALKDIADKNHDWPNLQGDMDERDDYRRRKPIAWANARAVVAGTAPSATVTKADALDARRYRRLQVLGCAPYGSHCLDEGLVLRFTGLDGFVDEDLKNHPTRGEASVPSDGGTKA